ncbi:MAG TPA: ABC transporter permease [Cytophagales bacterium]|nr:ABC transporter permease [Cytophagales bacterium]HAA22620.1 ABC transporter permease [Cytophagales bacterium]HAP63565.1 ABC transporter permease [Cytophagales bacterium]
MKKVLIVIRREYLVRVQKKTFLLLTFGAPLLIVGLIAAVVALTVAGKEEKTITILDETALFESHFEDGGDITYTFKDQSLDDALADLTSGKTFAVVSIPADLDVRDPKGVTFHQKGNPTSSITGKISRQMVDRIRQLRLEQEGIAETTLDSLNGIRVNLATFDITDMGEDGEAQQSSAGAAQGIGMVFAVIIYMFIFLYGAMVMRGVIEEKMTRIVEVIVSSIKPFQLMMGKVIGVALVGLTQLTLWVLLLGALGFVASTFLPEDAFDAEAMEALANTPNANAIQASLADNPELAQGVFTVLNMPWGQILLTFLFFFVGGYLMYGALFAAIGSAVDSDADSQQFMLPITIPLLIAYMAAFTVVGEDPNGPAAFWLSMIPLTSPIVMTIRVPYGGVEMWELLLSMVLLIGGFIGTIWLAGRIYRIGILMHGTKINYRVLAKWVKMKN